MQVGNWIEVMACEKSVKVTKIEFDFIYGKDSEGTEYKIPRGLNLIKKVL